MGAKLSQYFLSVGSIGSGGANRNDGKREKKIVELEAGGLVEEFFESDDIHLDTDTILYFYEKFESKRDLNLESISGGFQVQPGTGGRNELRMVNGLRMDVTCFSS